MLSLVGLAYVAAAAPTGDDAPDGPLGADGFRDVNDFAKHTSWLHGAVSGYATYGVALFGVLVVAGYLVARSRGSLPRVASALWVAIGTGAAIGLNQLVASAVDEPRPFVALPNVLLLVHHASDAGFPSDHAVMAGAIAAGLFFVSRLLGWVATAAAVLIAFARVYIGVHYPQDVLAGLALGAVVVVLIGFLVRPALVLLLTAIARSRLRMFVTSHRPVVALHPRSR